MDSKFSYSKAWKNIIMYVFLTMICGATVFGQGFTVTGTVVDDTGMGLPGTSVGVLGTNIGTVTNDQGQYTLNQVTAGAVLQFSFVGFVTQEIEVGSNRTIDVILREESFGLDELVVVGYGVQARRDITGSVAVVAMDELQQVTGSSAMQQLQGRASGVHVGSSGGHGAETVVRIRGINSVNSAAPLIVIDGVSTRNQDLSSINPNDIESMQILKDASSAAIYGAQAAHGVILITTRRGTRTGQPVVNYSGYVTLQNPARYYDLLNSADRMDLEWQMRENDLRLRNAWAENWTPGAAGRPTHNIFRVNDAGTGFVAPNYLSNAHGTFRGLDELPSDWERNYSWNPVSPGNSRLYAEFGDTDWYEEVTKRMAPMHSHNLSVRGGTDRGMYSISLNAFDQKSIADTRYFNRYSTRVNTSFNVRPWLRIGQNVSLTWTEQLGRESTAGEDHIFAVAYRASPWLPVYDMMGNLAGTRLASGATGAGNSRSPRSVLERGKNNFSSGTRIFGDVWSEIEPISGLVLRTQFGLDHNNSWSYSMAGRDPEFQESTGVNTFTESASFSQRWQWTNTATYRVLIQNIHRLTVLAGTEAITGSLGRSMSGSRTNYEFEEHTRTWTLSMGEWNAASANSSSYNSTFTLFGIFGRIDYALMDKYLLTVNLRRDGVSRFAESERYGVFPSASVGWRVTSEPFMAGTRNWLSDLRVRAGYGQIGNAEGPSAYNWADSFGTSITNANYDIGGSGSTAIGWRASRLGNPKTRWEAVETFNIGFDAMFYRGRFGLSFEAYDKTTTDMLISAGFSQLAGDATQPYINFGSIKNKGFDMDIFWKDSRGDFRWEATLTASRYVNEIVSISQDMAASDSQWGSGVQFTANAAQVTRTTTGQPISMFWGYVVDGFYENIEQVRARLPVGAAATVMTDDVAASNYIGQHRYAKLSNENPGVLTENDRTFIGNPHPDLYTSLNINLGYKQWDMTMFWYASLGNELFNNTLTYLEFDTYPGSNRNRRMLENSWKPTWYPGYYDGINNDAVVPILKTGTQGTYSRRPSSHFVENASFLRMQNLVIGYTVPRERMSRLGITNLRIYVQGENLLTFTKYTGLDPEFTTRARGGGGNDISRGIDAGGWPFTKRYTFGVNLTF